MQGKRAPRPHPSRLKFYIAEGILAGSVNGRHVTLIAFSGGGGGRSIRVGKDRHRVLVFGGTSNTVNNPYSTFLKSRGEDDDPNHVHGGAIPAGRYVIHPTKDSKPGERAKMGRCAKLVPVESNRMWEREGFFIHGMGKHGSDGCIVPFLQHDEFDRFLDDVDDSGLGILDVFESRQWDRTK